MVNRSILLKVAVAKERLGKKSNIKSNVKLKTSITPIGFKGFKVPRLL